MREKVEITVTGERNLKTNSGKKNCRWKIENGYIFNDETDKACDNTVFKGNSKHTKVAAKSRLLSEFELCKQWESHDRRK